MAHPEALTDTPGTARTWSTSSPKPHHPKGLTLDTYADLFDEDLDEVADRLDVAIRATADGLRTASKG